jgi:hypothetical protein
MHTPGATTSGLILPRVPVLAFQHGPILLNLARRLTFPFGWVVSYAYSVGEGRTRRGWDVSVAPTVMQFLADA